MKRSSIRPIFAVLLAFLFLITFVNPTFSKSSAKAVTTSAQTAKPVKAICGNGTIETGEDCDGKKLGKTGSCQQLGFESGILQCNKKTCKYDISQCAGKAVKKEKKAEQKVEKKPEKKVEKKTGIIDSAVQLANKAIQKVKEVVGSGKKKELQRTISPARVHERVNALKSGGPWWTIVTAPTECESNCLCRNTCYEAAEATCGENLDCLIAEFGSCPAGCQSGCFVGCRGEASAYSAAWTCSDTCITNYCSIYPFDCLVAGNLVVSACLEECGSTGAIEEFNRCADDCRSSCADTCSESSSSGSSSSGTSSSSSSSSASSSEPERNCLSSSQMAEARRIRGEIDEMRRQLPELLASLNAEWGRLSAMPSRELQVDIPTTMTGYVSQMRSRADELSSMAATDPSALTLANLAREVGTKLIEGINGIENRLEQIQNDVTVGRRERNRGERYWDQVDSASEEILRWFVGTIEDGYGEGCTNSGTFENDKIAFGTLEENFNEIITQRDHLRSRIIASEQQSTQIRGYPQAAGSVMTAFQSYEEANTKRKETAEQLTWIKELTDDPSWIISRKQPEAIQIAQESATLDTESGATLPLIDTAVRSAADATAVPQASTAREALDQAVAQKDVILQKNNEIKQKWVALIRLLSKGPKVNSVLAATVPLTDGPPVIEDWNCLTVPIALGLIVPPIIEEQPRDLGPISLFSSIVGIATAHAKTLPEQRDSLGPYFRDHREEILGLARHDIDQWLVYYKESGKNTNDLFVFSSADDVPDDVNYWLQYRAFNAGALLIHILHGGSPRFTIHEVTEAQAKESGLEGAGGWFVPGTLTEIYVVIPDDVVNGYDPVFAYEIAVHELVHLIGDRRYWEMVEHRIHADLPKRDYDILLRDYDVLSAEPMVKWAVDEIEAYGVTIALGHHVYATSGLSVGAWAATSLILNPSISRFGLVKVGLDGFASHREQWPLYQPIGDYLQTREEKIPNFAREMGYNLRFINGETPEISSTVQKAAMRSLLHLPENEKNLSLDELPPPVGGAPMVP